MEKALKAPCVFRKSFASEYEKMINISKKCSQVELKANFKLLEQKYEDIRAFDGKIFEHLLDTDASEDNLTTYRV